MYELIEVDLDQLDLDEWNVDEELVEEFLDLDIETMPIPLISDDYSIIDGIHRLNALLKLNYNKVYVYRGIERFKTT